MYSVYRYVSNTPPSPYHLLTVSIGIYTRDLIYNAQKPAFLDDVPVAGERLVNFERHHTAAMIVKSLLRLLEASSKYRFKPDPDILSKCLWMAALGDEELTALSRRCEA